MPTLKTRKSVQSLKAAGKPSMRPIQPLTKRISELIPQVVLACSLMSASHALAATVVWTGTGADGNWTTSGDWTGGVVPGTTSGTTNGDYAFFNATSGTTHVTIDSGRNLAGLQFGGGSTLNYTIGDNSGNALLLSSGGQITIGGNGVNNPGANSLVFTVAAPLVIEGNNATYSFANWAYNAVNPQLVLSGSITAAASSGTTTITLDGALGANAISGAISDGALGAKVALNQTNTGGNWTLSGANTFTGPVTVNGVLKLSGSSGSLASTLFNLNAGAFTVDNTTAAGGALNNRFLAGSSVNFNLLGGAFVYKGSDAAGVNSSDAIGTLNAIGGQSTVTVTYGGTNTATLNATAFNRSPGQATVLVNGAGLGKDSTSVASVARLFLGSTPGLIGNTAAMDSGNGTDGLGTAAAQDTQIVPFLVGEATIASGGLGTATGNANTFVTYDAVTGLRPLNPTNEFVNNSITSGSGSGFNTYIKTATTGSATATINSLVINGGNLAIADGATLTNSSGALLFVSNNAVNLSGTAGTGILDFGAAEGIVSVNNGVTGTIATGITGSGGLTKAGFGTLVFTGSPSYTGTTSIAAGTLQIGNGGTAGALSSGPIAVAGGANLTFNRTDTYGGSISPTIANAGSVNLVSGTLGFGGTISRPGSTGNLNVGVNGGNKAVLNLTGGSISSCLSLGASGIGVVNQSGGIFTNTAESYIGGNSGGYGLYNLTSGTLNLQSFLQVGSDGTGLFYQSGGLVSQTGPGIDFPRNGGTGVLYLTSGTFSASSVLFTWAGNVGRGEVNVAGGLLTSGGGVNFWNATPSTGVLNLDAGVLQTSSIYASSTGTSRVNFNGGTLRATASNGTLLGGVTSAVINSGGATIDTNGNNTTVSQALLAPTGSGVSYISIGGTGYSGAPYVKIAGDGTGATAVANIDGSGNLIGFAITNPGVGYTTGTVTLVGGGGTALSGTTLNFSANTSGGLTKNGAGTLTLTGSNTYTGTTTVNAGTLQVPIPAALASSTAVIVNNAGSVLALNYGGPSDYTQAQLTALLANTTFGSSAAVLGIDTTNLSGTYSGVIGISGGLTKLGTNALTLTGSNTYTGATTINSGTLQIGGNGSLGGGNYAGAISNAGALIFNSTANQTLSGIISGAGNLTQSGSSTLILAGSDNFTGTTTINAGTVQIGNGATGSILTSNTVTINSGGTLAINLANGGTFANAISMYVYQNPAASVNAVSSGTNTLSGNIAGTVYTTFNQNGTGTTILSGNNTYFGPTNINAGVLQLGNQSAASYSTVNVGVNNGLAFGVTAATIGGLSGSGNLALLSGSNVVTLTVGNNNANSSYSGSFSGGGSLTKTGTGAFTLSGTNSVLGNLTLNNGTINSSGGIANASNTGYVYVAPTSGNNAMLNVTSGSIGGVTVRLGDAGTGVLNQSGGYVISNGPSEFFLGSGGYGNFNLTSGTLAATNWFQIGGNGTGIMTQTGGVANYTGPGIEVPRYGAGTGVLYVNGGLFNSTAIISLGYDGGSGRGEVTVASGTLAVSNNVYFNAAGITGILNLDGGVLAANGIFKSGTATTGIVNFNGGTLRTTYNGGTYLGSSSTSTNAVNAAYVYGGGAIIDTYGNNNTFYQALLAPTGSGVSSISVTGTGYTGTPYVQITGNGTGATGVANIDANGNITGVTVTNPGIGYTSGTVILVGGGGATTSLGTVNLAANTSGGLTKSGSGTLTLTGSNTYTGATTVTGGALNIQNATALGDTSNGTTVAAGAALQIQGGVTVGAEAISLSGSGVANDGALRNISGTNSYTGTVTLATASRINSDAGLLILTNPIAGSGLNLTVGGAGTTTIATIATGSGSLTKDGAGTLNLTGSNGYTGGTTITAGTLNLTGSLDASSPVTVNGGTLTVGGTDTVGAVSLVNGTVNGAGTLNATGYTIQSGSVLANLSGTGSLTKTTTSTVTLTGTTTYTGATTVYGGNLVLSNTNGYTGTTTINPTTSLTLNFSAATAAQTNIINPGSALSLGGSLILTGSANATNSQTFNGTTILPGASTVVLTASTSNPLALKLGSSFTHNTGGTVDFTLPTGTQSGSNGILTTATNVSFTGGSNTILGGWATVGGTTWAVGGTSGTSTNISGLATYNSGLAAGTDVEAGNLGTITPATMTINSLRFNTAGTTTLNLNGPLTIASGGILRTSNASGDVNFNNSTITSGNGSDLTVINNQTGNWINIASQIVGNIGLTKSGAGSLSLTANNTFNGTVNLNAGILYISNSRALGTGGTGSLVFNGGALYLGSFGNAGSFSQDVSSKIAPVAFGQNAAINTNAASVTFGTPISGAGGLEKLGNGYLALTATNTYTGSTWIAGGYLTFSSLSNFGNGGSGGLKFQYGGLRWANGSTADISSLLLSNNGDTYLDTNGNNVVFNNAIATNSIAWTYKDGLGTLDLQNTYGNSGGFIERGGTVNIDFAGASAPATNIITTGAELRFNGGRVLITGKPGATNSETFGLWNFGVNGNGAGTLQFAQNGAAALNATLGSMNQRSVGNTLNIIPATTGTLTYTGGSASTILLSTGVPYATVNGSDWAASNAANNAIVGLSAAGGTGYTNSTSSTLSGNADIATGTDTTLAASGTITTLRFNQNQARTVTLSSTASLSTGGILVTPSVATAGSLITGGTLTASNNSNQDLVVFQNSPQPFTIASVIGNINGANGLTKSGTGNLILTGNNTYTGATNVNEGTLTLTGTRTGTTAAGTINVNGGTLAVTGGLLNTAGNTINIGASSSSVGSFNISGGTVFTTANVTLGNAQSGQGIINQSGGNFITSSVFTVGSGYGSFGALNLSGGVLTKLGSELWLGTGGSALVNISGGVMNLTNSAWMNPSRQQGANYTAFVLSGSGVLNTGNGVHENWGQNGGTVIVTVKDNAWLNEVNNTLYLGYNGGSGILNVAGGVTTLNNIQTSTGDVQNSSFVNFNGGILQATNGQGNFINGLTAATIYGGGATIDTMVFGNAITIPQPLLAPTGNGLSSLTVTGNTSGFLSAPIVQISGGGGTGASAIANIDGSGNLTGFTIVSPGSGYTSAPTVTLVGGGVALPTVTGSLASNAGTGGGLTKLGQSSLTLSGSNNYTGTTTITDGSLVFAPAANVTQSFGALAFNGGDGTVQSTFNSGSNALTFSSLAARPAGATRTFIVSGGTPTGATPTNKIVLTGQAAGFIDQGTFYGTSTGGNYAWYDGTNNYVRGINYGTDAGSVTTGTAVSLSGTYVQTTGAVSAQTTGTFTTLNISGNNGPFNLATGATLTVNGILKTGNNGWYNVTGGAGIQAAGNAELVVRVDQGGDGLHLYNSILANGTNALTKTGAGTLWLSGSSTYTGATNLAGGVLTIDTPYALGTGNITFKGGTLQYNTGFGGPVPDLSGQFSAIGANLNAVVDTDGYDAIYASSIAGPGSFQKNGTGTLTLSGSNTFGDLNLVGGVVNFANLNNLGTGKIVFNGGTLQYAPGNTADLSTRNVFLYGAATIDTNGNNITFANPVGATGAGAFTKIGAGTLRLTANNVWQGGTYVNEGTLQLDFSTISGANLGSILSTNSNLTLAGGSFILTGAANATNSQSVNGANFNAGASAIQLNANASSNPLLLTLNGFGRAAAGTLDLTLPTGTQSASNGVTTTSTTLVSNNVLVSAASNGIAFATVSGSNWASLSGNNIIPLASYNADTFTTATFNTDVTTTDAPAAFTVNTLRLSGAGAAGALTLASGTSVVNTGGILVTSAATGATIGGSGSIAPGAGKELVIIDNGALTINAPIANNAAGASALTLAGSGTTTLNGNSTYTGATVIDSGKVILGGSNALGAALSVNGGTLQITGTLNAGTQPIYLANTSGARAVVNVVSGGALNFNGGNLDLGTQAGAANVAVLNQSGGTVSGSATGIYAFAIGQAVDSYGVYNITGGNITAGEISIGLYGTGLLTQTSGTFTATNFFNLDRGVGSIGIANLSGGTLVGPAAGVCVGVSGRGELNVSGSATVNNAGHPLLVAGGQPGYGVGIVNLLGGTVLTDSLLQYYGTTSTGIFNFSGGTLKANIGNGTFLQGLTAAYINGAFGSYSGGAVLDTGGNNITIAQNLLAPTGNGVSLSGITVSGSGYLGAPVVQLVGGGGFGATAVASIDANGNLTGITITNPGVGYTSVPMLQLIGGGGLPVVTGNPTLVANTSGGLTKNGSGTLTLTGSNTYTGATTINAGVLQITSDAQLGAVPASPSTNIVLNGGQLINNNSSPSLAASRNISLTSSGGFIEAGWGPDAFTVNGQIGGSGGLGVIWDSGVTVLGGSNNYSGATTIGTTGNYYSNTGSANPTLRLGNNNALPGTDLIFGTSASANTATLDMSGFNATVAALSGSTNAVVDVLSSGTSTLTVGNNNASSTFQGSLRNTTGTLALFKTGTGTLTLNGANTYSGGTTVNQGTLALAGAGNPNNRLSGAISVSAGATLQLNNSNQISATGVVTLNGGTFALQSYGDYFRGLNLNGNSAVTSSAGIILEQASPTINVTGTNNTIASPVGLTSLYAAVSGNKTLTVNVTNSGDALTVSGAIANLSFDGGGAAASIGGISKTGAGVLTLTGTNTYTGATTISAGTLQVGNGGTNGSLSPSSAITDNATLVFNRSNALTQGTDFAAISGSGNVVQAGAGTTILSASNSYSGGTRVSGGTLQVGNANALGTGSLSVNGGALDLNGTSIAAGTLSGSTGSSITNSGTGTAALTTVVSGTATYAGNITNGAGNVALTQSGSGTLILSGSLSMAGLNANGGVTQLTQSGSIGAVNVAAGATLSMAAHSGSNYNVLDVSSLAIDGFSSGIAAQNTAYTQVDTANQSQNYGGLTPAGVAVTKAAVAAADAAAPASPEAVPEPGAFGLLLSGAIGLLGFRRKAKRGAR